MIDAPTEGPFYMFNLIRYREQAEYPDGRETDLTGREANALYAPFEFLTAIGARLVFSTEVDQQIDGDDIVWETVAIVEYPCPVAFFAMIAHPEFQARAIHKDAGVEKTIVMVTELAPSPLPDGFVPPEGPYPATEEDPAFELIHVQDFHEIAQYEEGVDEPERTGEEAWEMYVANGSAAGGERSAPTRRRNSWCRGCSRAMTGPGTRCRSSICRACAGFQALLDDETRQAGRYHRYAALAHNYSLITYPSVIDIPGAPTPGETEPPPVTDDGIGHTLHQRRRLPRERGGHLPHGRRRRVLHARGVRVGRVRIALRVLPRLQRSSWRRCCPSRARPACPATSIGQLTAAPASCTCD